MRINAHVFCRGREVVKCKKKVDVLFPGTPCVCCSLKVLKDRISLKGVKLVWWVVGKGGWQNNFNHFPIFKKSAPSLDKKCYNKHGR